MTQRHVDTTETPWTRMAGWLSGNGDADAGWRAVVVALVVGGVQVAGTFGAQGNQPDRVPIDAFGMVLLVVGPAALLLRMRYPVPVLSVTIAVTLLYYAREHAYGPGATSAIVATFTAITQGHRSAGWLGAAALYVGHIGMLLLFFEPPEMLWAWGVAAFMLLVLAGSEAVRVKQERAREAALAREEEERRRASEERLRIAQELHDVLAHHISLVNVQAGVGLHLMDRQPEQAREALTAIEQASREAMGELRSVLEILRRPEDAAPRAPAPSLTRRLDALRSQAAAGGLDVHIDVRGDPAPLGTTVDAAAYRVVQEAITNVIRHAAATSALVRLTYGADDLTVEVEDDGIGSPAHAGAAGDGRGNGIPGMRDRVEVLGGAFEAGPRPERGFRVRASLPLGGVE